VATLAGFSRDISAQDIANAAFWVPMGFAPVALLAAVVGARLAVLASRSGGKKART
jgi:hypothetical protein